MPTQRTAQRIEQNIQDTERLLRQTLAEAIQIFPPSDGLYNAIQHGCKQQGFTLSELSRKAGVKPTYLVALCTRRSNGREAKKHLAKIRQIAAPAELNS